VQQEIVGTVLRLAQSSPFYRPRMPKTANPFSVEETNFGLLGWLAEPGGYRYAPRHPVNGEAWPPIPEILLQLWQCVARYPAPPECCLVNLYRAGAKMGLHQDRDEVELEAPVVSLSLGDDSVFRFGGVTRKAQTSTVKLSSGDVISFGGPARLMFHGIDRVIAASSQLVAGGGRINLTLRRVTKA
jgi:alkylated DNA repair protein (DNA oxidative demethylase)